MNIKLFGCALLSTTILAACSGRDDSSDSSADGVTVMQLGRARETVEQFYGAHGPQGNYLTSPILTPQLKDRLQHPVEGSAGYNPFTSMLEGAAEFVQVDPASLVSSTEAGMNVRLFLQDKQYLATVKVRLSDNKISDVSINDECGPNFSLVGLYDMTDGGSTVSGKLEIYYSDEAGDNCAIARCWNDCGASKYRSVALGLSGTDTVKSDSSPHYTSYAGPVKLHAPSACIDAFASFGIDHGNDFTMSAYKDLTSAHCR